VSEQVQNILNAYGQLGVEGLRQRVPKATGKTAASIQYEVDFNRLRIFARDFFLTLETGRGPRKSSAYQGFDENLLEWMKARGIGADLSEKKRKQLARFFSFKINKEGDATFKSGGKDVYSDFMDKFVEELSNEIVKVRTKEYADRFVELIKTNGTIGS
jgi:hypothetical protein